MKVGDYFYYNDSMTLSLCLVTEVCDDGFYFTFLEDDWSRGKRWWSTENDVSILSLDEAESICNNAIKKNSEILLKIQYLKN